MNNTGEKKKKNTDKTVTKKQERLKDEIQLIVTALGTGDVGGKRRKKIK